jgi:hypothetical protein
MDDILVFHFSGDLVDSILEFQNQRRFSFFRPKACCAIELAVLPDGFSLHMAILGEFTAPSVLQSVPKMADVPQIPILIPLSIITFLCVCSVVALVIFFDLFIDRAIGRLHLNLAVLKKIPNVIQPILLVESNVAHIGNCFRCGKTALYKKGIRLRCGRSAMEDEKSQKYQGAFVHYHCI